MLTNPDFKELLNLLKKRQCRYLIIGAYAVMKYSEPRFTKDLDIAIAIDEENAKRVFEALKDFGAPLTGLSKQDFAKEGYFYKMGVPPLRVDIMMSVPGLNFDQAWENREIETIDGVEMVFISKQDLILTKRASGRPQDLLDLEVLT